MQLLAHCGANWPYCDGASIAGGVFMLWLIRRSVKRAERHARRRADERLAARAIGEVAAKEAEQDRSQDTPLL